MIKIFVGFTLLFLLIILLITSVHRGIKWLYILCALFLAGSFLQTFLSLILDEPDGSTSNPTNYIILLLILGIVLILYKPTIFSNNDVLLDLSKKMFKMFKMSTNTCSK